VSRAWVHLGGSTVRVVEPEEAAEAVAGSGRPLLVAVYPPWWPDEVCELFGRAVARWLDAALVPPLPPSPPSPSDGPGGAKRPMRV
jgi:hypothetical protein